MSRIKLDDSMMSIAMKMGEGNPGALTAIMELVTKGAEIDPQSAWCGLGPIMALDTLEIYGSSIYVLWNDKCGRDVRKLTVLTRAQQLGFITAEKLQMMAADQMRTFNMTDEEYTSIDKQVCDALSEFQKPRG